MFSHGGKHDNKLLSWFGLVCEHKSLKEAKQG